jgi:uncharacterized protein (TIGR02231 family)
MKRFLFIILLLPLFVSLNAGETQDAKSEASSKITSVKLFTNRAEITRTAKVKLSKGLNTVVIAGLPDNLFDWSLRGSLPEKFNGKILSMEISRQALTEKRKKRIAEIEKKLEELRDLDAGFVDDLANIKSQEEFLNSVNDFTKQNASKELQTRIPQVELWGNTLDYVSKKRKDLQTQSRLIQKKRRELAKEIQKWEFELAQIAGASYFSGYQKINKAMEKNISQMQVQQYSDLTDQYAAQQNYLKSDNTIETEKSLILSIASNVEGETEFSVIYMIPNTYWQMIYDFRASKLRDEVEIFVYANIYQKSGEDWDNVFLSLSTGEPRTISAIPSLPPWFLSVYKPEEEASYYKSAMPKRAAKEEYSKDEMELYDKDGSENFIPETAVKEVGFNFEISFPLRQTIVSSEKYQKKLIKSYSLKSPKSLKYFYKTVPASAGSIFLMAKVLNQTELSWLPGEAQVFLENEFIGKVNIPHTPVEKEQNIVLGIAPDMIAKKELITRYDDTAGVFGGNKRIVYSYKITLENNGKEQREIVLLDNFPVSKDKEITVEIKDLSDHFVNDEETKKSTEYQQGIRKFIINIPAGAKKEITYKAIITYDKNLVIEGLR